MTTQRKNSINARTVLLLSSADEKARAELERESQLLIARAKRRRYYALPGVRQKERERVARWRAENPERRREYYREWAARNVEKLRAYARNYYARNEERRAYVARKSLERYHAKKEMSA